MIFAFCFDFDFDMPAPEKGSGIVEGRTQNYRGEFRGKSPANPLRAANKRLLTA
jgi:hypothetical protein